MGAAEEAERVCLIVLNRSYQTGDCIAMKRLLSTLLLLLMLFSAALSQEWGNLSCRQEVSAALRSADGLILADRIDSLWSHFRGNPYLSGTLTPAGEKEELIVRLDSFDCVTWIDHAVALLSSQSQEEYLDNLISNRYCNNEISFATRRHFFTDWLERPDWGVPEFAKQINSRKVLNRRSDSTCWITGLPLIERDIQWITTDSLTDCGHLLRDGDLVGFWTELPGLDVSHVGMLQIKSGKPWLLHASSETGKLESVDFFKYASNRNGMIIIRKQWSSE